MNADERRSVGWSRLPRKAKAWRLLHGAWSVAQLSCLGYIWASALTGRRDRMLRRSIGLLLVEGAALVVGRGNCPVGPLQAEWGDPIPFFELLLPARAAKAAVPALAIVSVAGIAAIVVIPPGFETGRTRRRTSLTPPGGRRSYIEGW